MRQADRLAAAKTLNMGKRVSVFFLFFSSMRLNSTSPFKTVDLPSVSELEAITEQSASQKDRYSLVLLGLFAPLPQTFIFILTSSLLMLVKNFFISHIFVEQPLLR